MKNAVFSLCAVGALALAFGTMPGCSCSSAGEGGDGGGGGPGTVDGGGEDTGAPVGADMGPVGCGLVTCASMNAGCGPIGDGCGGMLDCGSCTAPKTCGGGGTPFQCGGNSGCVPKTCAQLGFNCGPAGDGCGGKLDCGSCPTGQACGANGKPSECGIPTTFTGADGGTVTCVKRTCAQANADCGPVADGCGGLLSCGNCTAPQACGGGGVPSKCGGNTGCMPKTCAQLGFNCGPAGDGCGNILQCGSCSNGNICGGGGKPGVCGGSTTGGSSCPGGAMTTISGTVVAPTVPDPANGITPDPIYGAVVYVPSGALGAITTGATCDQCTTSQAAVVSTTTGVDGKFKLINPPTTNPVTVVIQLGKWRRVLSVNVTACQDNPLTQAQTRLPRKQKEFTQYDNIPRFAVDTGDVDVLQCVLRKMGIDDTEFTNPNLNGSGIPQAAGRVQFYQGGVNSVNGAGGAVIDNRTPTEDQLWGSQATLNSYDAVLFPCEGGQDDENSADQARVSKYADIGGRVFATHFSYVWLYNNMSTTPSYASTATWNINSGSFDGPNNGLIDQGFPKGQALAQWLQIVNASTTLGIIPVNVIRHDFDTPLSSAQRWMYVQNASPGNGPGDFPIHYTFNTPVGASAANQCGRVVFSDFHVENIRTSNGVTFPNECQTGAALTPQEKLLEFFLFDLTSCVAPDMPPPPKCTKLTCAQIPATCGIQGDGCGGTLDCGPCVAPQTCGGGGVANQCGAIACTKVTCASMNIACGPAGDGCGGMQDCGSCPTGQFCGGGGVPGQCGSGQSCAPLTCQQQKIGCGPAGDGCGNAIDCGPCPMGQTCGGGGVPGQCGAPNCTPRTCQAANANCGIIGDGCGNTINCGSCTPPATCGGGGFANQCGQLM